MGSATSIIKLSLQSNQYEQGLRGAKRQFEDFTASIGINMKKMTAFGLAAGAAASAINGLTSAISTAMTEGTRMANEMEGVRAAFKRLDQPNLLGNLREATHGTVNDLELMKQAVKFDNFNLSLEQMGTFLAFAQQQAKDTGQDVGYLVDSIVTGLGRKSLPILDNLGLSATEIRERMKETGDMTKAVADIIQERMAAAGGYVETASDRAAKATADLENAMTSLGETFAPLVGASDSLWNSIKIGAINALNTAVKPLIQALAEAGALGSGARATAGFNRLGGGSKVDRMIGRLGNGKTAGAYSIYQQQLGEFDKYINNKRFQIAAYGSDNSGVAQSAKAKLQAELDGALKMREEYVKRAQELHNQVPSPAAPASTSSTGGGGGRSAGGGIKEEKDDFEEIIGLIPNAQEAVRSLQQQISQSWDEGEIAKLTADLKVAQEELQRLQNIGKETPMVQGLSGFNQETMSAWMQGRQSDLSKAEYGSPDYSSIMGNIADMNIIKSILEQSVNAGINAAEFNVAPMWNKIFGEALPEGMEGTLSEALSKMYENAFDGMDIGDSAFTTLVDSINEKLKDLGIEPIEIPVKTVGKDVKSITEAARTTADVVGSIGDAFNAIEDPAAKVMGTVMQAIASVALGYAQATVQATSMGPWAWVAFAATGLATMLSTISAIHSATGYAQGGIVKGNSYSGDNIYGGPDAMVNAGELVLTKAQQSTLASQLQEGGMRNLNLSGRIRGTDIIMSVDRTLSLEGKQLLTWGR